MTSSRVWLAAAACCGFVLVASLGCDPSAKPEAAAGPPTSGSVVLITIDTLRADRLPLYGYDRGATPNLDALAGESVVFEDAQSHAPITLPSHTSILTGLYPPQHGIRNNGAYTARDDLLTLAERLSLAGYRTGAFVSAFVLDSRFGLDQGFDVYDDDLEDGRQRWSKFGVKDRRAEMTIDRALEWIDGLDAEAPAPPFFGWVHLYDPHYAYEAPEPFASRHADPYDAEIAYTDSQLGRLLDALRSRPDFDDLTLVVTADHGESLGEHGESTHSIFVYQATQHVPLLIRFPRARHAAERSSITARHIDIVPTILDVLGLEDEPPASGRSLLAALDAPQIEALGSYSEAKLPEEQFGWAPLHALSKAGFKYIEAPREELYDLAADPDERVNLVHEQPERARAMAEELARFRDTFADDRPGEGPSEMDAETRAQLIALGYLTPGEPSPSQAGRDPKDMIEQHEDRERAHRWMDSGRYAEAISILTRLLEDDPTNTALRLDMAASHAESASWDDAEREYEAVLAANPERTAALVGLAKIHFKARQDFERAEQELDLAQALTPEDPGIWGVRGDLLHELGRYPEAIEAYRRALDAGDRTPSFLLGLASALHLSDQLEEAQDMIERMLRIENDNPIGHYNHGVILMALDLPAAAEGAFREAIRLDPDLITAQLALARLLVERERPREAVAVYRSALQRQPRDLELLTELGILELRGGATELAISRLEQGAKLAPRDARLRLQLGRAYQQAGRFAEAEAQFAVTVAGLPARAPLACEALFQSARSQAARHEGGGARQSLDRAEACGGERMRLMISRDPLLAPLATS